MPLPRHLLTLSILSIIIISGCISETPAKTNQTEPPLPPPIPALPAEGQTVSTDSITGMTPHSVYHGFSEPETFSLPTEYVFSSTSDTDSISLTINDAYIYRYAFISLDGGFWNYVDLAGTLSDHYITGSATASIPIDPNNFSLTTPGQTKTRNYIVTYTCDSGFQCHDGWQIRQFNAIIEEPSPPSWQQGLVSWWKLDNNADDSVGTNHGTNYEAILSNTNCVSNNCSYFDGVNSYIDIPLLEIFDNIAENNFTISFWIDADDVTGSTGIWTRILELRYDDDNFVQFVIGDNNGELNFILEDAGTQIAIMTNSPVSTNMMYNVVGTWNSNTNNLKLYLNGALQSATGSAEASSGNLQKINLGRRTDGNSETYYEGIMDEVMVWDRLLNSTEINSMYSSFGYSPPAMYCGDDSCNNGETCSTCPEDCGNCPDIFDIIFNHDFETNTPGVYDYNEFQNDWNIYEDWTDPRCDTYYDPEDEDGCHWDDYGQIKIIEEDGNKFLRHEIKDGEVSTGVDHGMQWWHYLPADSNFQELYLSYKLRFKEGFEPVLSGKFHGFSGNPYVAGSVPAYDEGFIARMTWSQAYEWEDPRWKDTVLYVYHQDQVSQEHGDAYRTYYGLPDNVWMNFTLRVVMNTIEDGTVHSDGICEIFINGDLYLNETKFRFRNFEDMGIDILSVSNFFGGSGEYFAPVRDEWIDFDDFVVFAYKDGVDVPMGNEPSPPGRVLVPPY